MATTAAEARPKYQATIGIECHVELKTKTKMFCGCKNEFGGEPNTKVCAVCLGLPGSLPVANERAIEAIVRAGLAFGAEVPTFSKFDRKNYFYPDMPKDYQISQYDMPLCKGGVVRFWLEDGTRRECRLTRIHLEEDTGKSIHAGSEGGRLAGSAYSLVDFNRAGVPLMECVSEPELHGAEDAVAYLEALRRTFVQLGISDVKMEEGSLRCDANVSVRLFGADELGTKTEIKNMNSFRSVRLAIESEIARQVETLESGGRIVQETRGWNEAEGVTHTQRSKEEAHDYRYFPDPDLVPIELDADWIQKLRSMLPPSAYERYARYVDEYGLPTKSATQLVEDGELAAYFEAAVRATGAAQACANFVLGDLARLSNETGTPIASSRVGVAALAELVALAGSGAITSKVAKDVFDRVWRDGGSPKEIVEREGLAQVSDVEAIRRWVDEVVTANGKTVEEIRKGKTNALGFLKGQVMKASRGRANPAVVDQLLAEATRND